MAISVFSDSHITENAKIQISKNWVCSVLDASKRSKKLFYTISVFPTNPEISALENFRSHFGPILVVPEISHPSTFSQIQKCRIVVDRSKFIFKSRHPKKSKGPRFTVLFKKWHFFTNIFHANFVSIY